MLAIGEACRVGHKRLDQERTARGEALGETAGNPSLVARIAAGRVIRLGSADRITGPAHQTGNGTDGDPPVNVFGEAVRDGLSPDGGIWTGPLDALLDSWTEPSGYEWRYDADQQAIEIVRRRSAVFQIHALAGKQHYTVSASTQDSAAGGDGEGSGGGNLTSQTISTETDYDPWPEIEGQLKGLLDPGTRLSVDRAWLRGRRQVALRAAGAAPERRHPGRGGRGNATLEEIAVAWRAAGEAAARRVKRLFEDAAAARASDVVFETGGGACHVFAIVNDRKLPLAEPMTAEEGREAAGFLFHCKDEGSSQTSYRRGSFQGFSIRAGGQVPLPAGVSALRCQRGPHEPDGDHLFARMFYADRLDPGMTLERLGFSETEAALFAGIRMAPHGGVFIGGTAGDGKSTTLAANLALQMAEFDGQLNLVTIEDGNASAIAILLDGRGDAVGATTA